MSPIQSLQPVVGLPGPYTMEALVDNPFAFLLWSLWNLHTVPAFNNHSCAQPEIGSPHFWGLDSPAEEALLGHSCPAPAAPSLLASPHASSGRAAQHQPPALLLAVCSCTSLCRISPILGMGAAIIQLLPAGATGSGLQPGTYGCRRSHGEGRGSCDAWSSWLAESPPVSSVLGAHQGINPRHVTEKGIIVSPFAAVSVESRVNLLPPCR